MVNIDVENLTSGRFYEIKLHLKFIFKLLLKVYYSNNLILQI